VRENLEIALQLQAIGVQELQAQLVQVDELRREDVYHEANKRFLLQDPAVSSLESDMRAARTEILNDRARTGSWTYTSDMWISIAARYRIQIC
jgi:hypothetical protein